MDTDNLKDIFDAYQPQGMASDSAFLDRLSRNLDLMETVKLRNDAFRRRTRIAVIAAALAGFVAGIVMSTLYHLFIVDRLAAVSLQLPLIMAHTGTIDLRIAGWLLLAVASVLISVNVYEAVSYIRPAAKHHR